MATFVYRSFGQSGPFKFWQTSCKLFKKKIAIISGFNQNISDVASTDLRPLKGIRVLDLTRILAGPYCAMILGDYGAEVIKVEKPDFGDDTRGWGPPFVGSESCYFLAVNRNKKSIGVNMKSVEGKEIITQLAKHSDVLIENYLTGKLIAIGLGFDELHKVAPQLIYCSLTGYGSSGPLKSKPGYDIIAAAHAGLLHITGPENGEPCKVGVAMTDLTTGLYAHGAIMAALIQRSFTGVGQKIECSLLSSQVASLVNVASAYLNTGLPWTRMGTAHGNIVPYQAFQTKDGHLVIGAGNNKQFINLCKLMDLNELSEDPKYISNDLRVENRISLIQIISERFLKETTSDWLKILKESNIPHGPINDLEQVFNDPQVSHNKLIQEIQHSKIGKIRVPGPAVQFSDSSTSLRLPPPTFGQHTDEIMMEILHYDDSKIQMLKKKGVIA